MTQNDQYGSDTLSLDLQLLALNEQQPVLGRQDAPQPEQALTTFTDLLKLIYDYRDVAEQRGAAKAKGRPNLALTATLNEMELQIAECLEALTTAQGKGVE